LTIPGLKNLKKGPIVKTRKEIAGALLKNPRKIS